MTTVEPGIALKINFDAYRPKGSNFEVYYRTCQSDEDIYEFNWTEAFPITDGYAGETEVPNDEDLAAYGEFEYFVGDLTGVTPADDMPSFTQYQVKITFKSQNTSASPILRNIRVISIAT